MVVAVNALGILLKSFECHEKACRSVRLNLIIGSALKSGYRFYFPSKVRWRSSMLQIYKIKESSPFSCCIHVYRLQTQIKLLNPRLYGYTFKVSLYRILTVSYLEILDYLSYQIFLIIFSTLLKILLNEI